MENEEARSNGIAILSSFPFGALRANHKFRVRESRANVCFDSMRIDHRRRVPLMMLSSFSMSSREGFWPESVQKKAGRYAAKGCKLKPEGGKQKAKTAGRGAD